MIVVSIPVCSVAHAQNNCSVMSFWRLNLDLPCLTSHPLTVSEKVVLVTIKREINSETLKEVAFKCWLAGGSQNARVRSAISGKSDVINYSYFSFFSCFVLIKEGKTGPKEGGDFQGEEGPVIRVSRNFEQTILPVTELQAL